MRSLRGRLILLFAAATVPPLAGTLWVTQTLVSHSLSYSNPAALDTLSRLLERTGREYYLLARESLERAAASGVAPSAQFAAGRNAEWPAEAQAFWDTGEQRGFQLAAPRGDALYYFERRGAGLAMWRRPLTQVPMEDIAAAFREARGAVGDAQSRDLPRGFFYTTLLLVGAVWVVSLGFLIWLANRASRPVRRLTAGLGTLAGGDFSVRLTAEGEGEVAAALAAFNRTAAELEQSRARLIYLTQVASWQMLARKMAHEVKNSLTPIRLNVEEIVARAGPSGGAYLEQAAQMISEEIRGLERMMRAFSELGAEPPIQPAPLPLNPLVEERAAFLGHAHPEVSYRLDLAPTAPVAHADPVLVRGILSNLMENAAEAAGGGAVLLRTAVTAAQVSVEVHDSGPGLSAEARRSLFEPTISRKRGGMGLGLSIARKNALSMGGDILPIESELGGAGFRLLLARAGTEPCPSES